MITQRPFGKTAEGQNVTCTRIENVHGAFVCLLDYGATIQSIVLPTRSRMIDVCLGYDSVAAYEGAIACAGSVIGRFANRIGQGRFVLNGKTYQLATNSTGNHLHGGMRGFHRYMWDTQIQGDSVIYSRVSPNEEEGYPGNLEVRVEYRFTDDCKLCIRYSALSDADTVVNLTNHVFFNLNGHDSGSAMSHRLMLNAEAFLENDKTGLPTGRILSVRDTPFDFRQGKTLSEGLLTDAPQIQLFGGYDHNFALSRSRKLEQISVLCADQSGIAVRVLSNQPGVQLYTANGLPAHRGKSGALYSEHGAICLETQNYPNATAFKHFPSPILRKNECYCTQTQYCFELPGLYGNLKG